MWEPPSRPCLLACLVPSFHLLSATLLEQKEVSDFQDCPSTEEVQETLLPALETPLFLCSGQMALALDNAGIAPRLFLGLLSFNPFRVDQPPFSLTSSSIDIFTYSVWVWSNFTSWNHLKASLGLLDLSLLCLPPVLFPNSRVGWCTGTFRTDYLAVASMYSPTNESMHNAFSYDRAGMKI